MGTSTSSSGGKAGSPFDPEWLAPEGQSSGGAGSGDSDQSDSGSAANGNDNEAQPGADANQVNPPALAPSRRYSEARARMSAYLAGGGNDTLRAATRSLVNKGMGGASRASSTMRGTAQAAGALGQFLSAARDGSNQAVRDWVERTRQANLSADDLILELVKEVIPNSGSVDDESIRNAAAEALGELYELNPTIDIFQLSDIEIHDVIAITIANDVCNRIDLQLGQSYEKLKYSPVQIQHYRNDIREYVKSEVRVVMASRSSGSHDPRRLAQEVLKSALEVFGS